MTTHEQWQLTLEAAELYEHCPARYILGPWAPLLVDAANLAPDERVLDVACGTGVVTRIAAKRVGPMGRVVGVDLNPGMIAVAQSLPAPAGARIEWLERSALDLRLEDASFDVVLCQQGLQFFPDKVVALREMHRVLNHGGRLALSVWNGTGLYNNAVGDALARLVGNEVAVRFNASRQVPTAEDLRSLATEAGFSAVDVRVSRIDVHLPVWINSYWTIWPQRQSHPLLLPPILRHARKLARVSWNSCGAIPMAMELLIRKKRMC